LNQESRTMSAFEAMIVRLQGEISQAAARLSVILRARMAHDTSDEDREDLWYELRRALDDLETLLEQGNYLRRAADGRLVEND
jgi:hypothetical protein